MKRKDREKGCSFDFSLGCRCKGYQGASASVVVDFFLFLRVIAPVKTEREENKEIAITPPSVSQAFSGFLRLHTLYLIKGQRLRSLASSLLPC